MVQECEALDQHSTPAGQEQTFVKTAWTSRGVHLDYCRQVACLVGMHFVGKEVEEIEVA
jgi:hypothetical protein